MHAYSLPDRLTPRIWMGSPFCVTIWLPTACRPDAATPPPALELVVLASLVLFPIPPADAGFDEVAPAPVSLELAPRPPEPPDDAAPSSSEHPLARTHALAAMVIRRARAMSSSSGRDS